MVRDKIFLFISTLYFFNESIGMQVNFSAAFHLVLALDFVDVFHVKDVTAHYE